MFLLVFCLGFFPKRNLIGSFVSIIPFIIHIFLLFRFCFFFCSPLSQILIFDHEKAFGSEGGTQIVGKFDDTVQALFYNHM